MLDPEVTIKHIRENIRQKIQDAGYATIEKFAYENGLTKSTITRAINGSRNPRLITLIEIANGLNINLSELLDLRHIEHIQEKKSNHKRKSNLFDSFKESYFCNCPLFIRVGWAGKPSVAGRRLSPAEEVESNEVRTRGIPPPFYKITSY